MSQQRIWERWRLYPAVLTPTMRRPRVESSSPVEYIKKEVVRKHSKAKNPGTLAASSSSPSIAFYICSPFCDPSDAAPNALGSSKESAWKTTYGVAKIAVDITKESFDMFLPLKAVAGELAALIKNYEQTIANVEQIGDIEERIQSLAEVLASPVGDHDGRVRREVLRRNLAGVVIKFGPLSEQYGF